jgi:hypothetical protein
MTLPDVNQQARVQRTGLDNLAGYSNSLPNIISQAGGVKTNPPVAKIRLAVEQQPLPSAVSPQPNHFKRIIQAVANLENTRVGRHVENGLRIYRRPSMGCAKC